MGQPTEVPALKTLLREARKAQSRQGVNARKKTAVVLEPLLALLATATTVCVVFVTAPCSCWLEAVAVGAAQKWSAYRSAMYADWMPTPGSTLWARPRPTPVAHAGRNLCAHRPATSQNGRSRGRLGGAQLKAGICH